MLNTLTVHVELLGVRIVGTEQLQVLSLRLPGMFLQNHAKVGLFLLSGPLESDSQHCRPIIQVMHEKARYLTYWPYIYIVGAGGTRYAHNAMAQGH